MRLTIFPFLFICTLLLTACTSRLVEPAPMPSPAADNTAPTAVPAASNPEAAQTSTPTKPATQGSSQMANPASKYCIDKGGRLEIRTAADGGQVGICVFPNGKECEEWAFMRGQCNPEDETNQLYNNPEYQFMLSYPPAWTLSEEVPSGDQPFSLVLQNGSNSLRLQVKHNTDQTVIDAAPPEGGEISQAAVLSVLGQDVPLQVVKLEGVVKSAAVNVHKGDLLFYFQIDNPIEPEIPPDILQAARGIIESLRLID